MSKSVSILLLSVACFAAAYNLIVNNAFETFFFSMGQTTPYPYKLNAFYAPSLVERYVLENSVELNYHRDLPKSLSSKHSSNPHGCTVWKPSSKRISEYLQTFRSEMERHSRLLDRYRGSPVTDVRQHLHSNICYQLEIHPAGLGGIFASGSLGRSPHGLMEPVYPPFESLSKCHGIGSRRRTEYWVHDFSSMCLQLSEKSKIILVDVGYKSASNREATMELLELYRKFGFPMDTIYYFDTSTAKNSKEFSNQIYETEKSSGKTRDFASTDSKSGRVNHPWDWIPKHTKEEDFIIVTVHMPPRGVDPSKEMNLIEELHHAEAAKYIDNLYFQPIVYMEEDENLKSKQSKSERETARWTVQESVQLFEILRRRGVPARAWGKRV